MRSEAVGTRRWTASYTPSVTSGLDQLSSRQRELVDQWLPGVKVEVDHSWGLVETTVLQVQYAGSRLIIKAGGRDDHHLEREIRAHLEWLTPWTSIGRAPKLRHCDPEAKVVVTDYLPGRLVLGTEHVDDPDAYRQAGALLAAFHAQSVVTDPQHEHRENQRALAWIDSPHRITPAVEERLRAEIDSWPEPSAELVPTHGDWQPRNWLIHGGVVSVIDLGRAALRPALTDFARLAAQDFRRDPALEAAFLEGYGPDPREPGAWHRTQVREAIGTASWAHQVGDEPFEAQGHRMIAEALLDVPAG